MICISAVARAVLLVTIVLCSSIQGSSCAAAASRKLLDGGAAAAGQALQPSSQPNDDTLESYACITSGVMRHPCTVNPGTIFAPGFSALNSSSIADRAYQAILAQHVLCKLHDSQASCQAATPAAMWCSWDSYNGRCVPDPYASLMLPLSCPGSKLHTMMRCGRAGVMGGCASDAAECATGTQGRCYPRWLVDQAKQGGKDEQSLAEAAAVAILEGDADMLGTCPEAQLLLRLLRRCPYQANWEGCDLNVCEFATPHFVPLRPSSLRLPNVTAPTTNRTGGGGSVLPPAPGSTQLMVTEAAMQAAGSGNVSDAPAAGAVASGLVIADTSSSSSSSSSSNATSSGGTGLQYYDAYPSPVCFVDASKAPMLLHTLLGVSAGLEAALTAAQAACNATEDVFMDVALGVEACGYERLSIDLAAPLKVAGVPRKPPSHGGGPAQQQQQQQQQQQHLKEQHHQQAPSPSGGARLDLPHRPATVKPAERITTEALSV